MYCAVLFVPVILSFVALRRIQKFDILSDLYKEIITSSSCLLCSHYPIKWNVIRD
jgi:hypothetical protein